MKFIAHNLIFKRITVSNQSNMSSMENYVKLVERLPTVENIMLNLCYKILQKFFALTANSINDKKFNNFKHAGVWLGRMTIGRGVPVPIHKLHLKNILINSFTKGNRLSMNVSIILKIL